MSAALQAFSPEACDILIDWVLVFLVLSALLIFNGKYEAVSNGMWMLGMSMLMSCIPGMDLPLQFADLRELVGTATGFLG